MKSWERRVLFHPDLHQVIEECRARAEIGETSAGGGVAVDAVGGVLVPPHALSDDGAGLDCLANNGTRLEAAAIVEDPHSLTVTNASSRGVMRMNLHGHV